jgi:hypothetical protein
LNQVNFIGALPGFFFLILMNCQWLGNQRRLGFPQRQLGLGKQRREHVPVRVRVESAAHHRVHEFHRAPHVAAGVVDPGAARHGRGAAPPMLERIAVAVGRARALGVSAFGFGNKIVRHFWRSRPAADHDRRRAFHARILRPLRKPSDKETGAKNAVFDIVAPGQAFGRIRPSIRTQCVVG